VRLTEICSCKKRYPFCDGVVFFVDRSLLMGANTFNSLNLHILSKYLNHNNYDARIHLPINRCSAPVYNPIFLSQPEIPAIPSSDPKIPNSIPHFSQKRFCSSGLNPPVLPPFAIPSYRTWHSHSSIFPGAF
jgi:hypothetical protein